MKSWSERASLVGGGAGIFTDGWGRELHWWVGQGSSLVGGAGRAGIFTGGQGRELYTIFGSDVAHSFASRH